MDELVQLLDRVVKAAPEFLEIGGSKITLTVIFGIIGIVKTLEVVMELRSKSKVVGNIAKRLLIDTRSFEIDRVLPLPIAFASAVIMVLSESLMLKVAEKIFKFRYSSAREQNSVNITVVGILIGRKAKQLSVAYALLTIAMISYLLFSFFTNYELSAAVLFVISAFFLVAFINEKSLEYRIKHGLYGSNEYEAREILSFILNHADTADFTSGGGLRDIIPAPEPDHVYGTSPVEGVERVTA